MTSIIIDLIRIIFVFIDRIVILVMDLSYSLLMKLAALNIVNEDVIKTFSGRIGLIIGIFMLFNLAINLLNYIASPDKFSDNKQGGKKIIANVLISLLLLGTYGFIFETAYKVQFAVIKKQLIPQIIFGTAPKEDTEKSKISYYIYSSMISLDAAIDPEGVCGYLQSEVSEECYDLIEPLLNEGYDEYEQAIEEKDAWYLLSFDNINVMDQGVYVFDYLFVFSTVVGVIVTLILLGFCLDIAKRSVKLYFLQIIAPLPIIANMMPGKGEETFKKWYKAAISTYVDIFIRLIAIFFAVFLISLVYKSLGTTFKYHPFLGVFIIIGALMFAKEIPQLIQDLTGIKLDGNFTINPLKKIQQAPLAAATLGYAGARVGGAVANIWGTSVNNKNIRKQLASEGLVEGTQEYKERFKADGGRTLFGNKGGYVGSMIAGSHSAGIRSFWIGAKGGGNKGLGQIMTEGIAGASQARNQRTSGFDLPSKIMDRATDVAKIKNDYGTTDLLKGKVKELQRQLDNAKRDETDMTEYLRTRMNEMENRHQNSAMDLREVFNNAANFKADGSFDSYIEKTYSDYTNVAVKREWINSQAGRTEADWNNLSEADKQTELMHLLHSGTILDEKEFNDLNTAYNRRNSFDVECKQIEKQIKSTQENMAKKNGGK